MMSTKGVKMSIASSELKPRMAFAAASHFLYSYFLEKHPFGELGEFMLMISDMTLNRDYVPLDQAYMDVWYEILKDRLNVDGIDYYREGAPGEDDCATITARTAFQAMTMLVRYYRDTFEFTEHDIYFTEMKLDDEGITTDPTIWDQWLAAWSKAASGEICEAGWTWKK